MTRLRLNFAVAWLIGCGAGCGASAAETPVELAKKVEAIFRQHCYRCHGERGKAESELYVLDRESLVPKRVTPGSASKSLLLAKVRSGEMPSDKDPLSQADQDTIRQWIDAGAVDFAPAKATRKFISPSDTFATIAADLKRIEQDSPDDLAFTRYFTITHLYNAGLNDDQLATYRNALSKLVNSLSWGRKVRVPRAVDPQQTLFAIDLRDYKWNESVWDAIVAQNPYSVKYDSASAKYGYQVTGTELPVVRGDWFVAAASRPPLYHEILYDRTQQIPDPDKPGYDRKLEKLLQVDVEENLRTKRVARAGFNGSGVSQNNRLLERHESDLTNGAYWKSYDFAGNEGRKNLFTHPLGPTGPNAFDQDGGEIIFNLPNGLQAYLLVDAKGKRIDKGPLNVVSDPVQKDRAVVNGLSCMSCHAQGMIRKPDEIREHVVQNQGSFTASEVRTVLALYPTAKTFGDLQQEDADRFTKAVKETGTPVGTQEPIVQLALRFEAELSAKLVAAELGLTVEDFLKGLDRSPELSRTLGTLKVPGRTIKRDVFVSTFARVVRKLELGTSLTRTAGSGLQTLAVTSIAQNFDDPGATFQLIEPVVSTTHGIQANGPTANYFRLNGTTSNSSANGQPDLLLFDDTLDVSDAVIQAGFDFRETPWKIKAADGIRFTLYPATTIASPVNEFLKTGGYFVTDFGGGFPDVFNMHFDTFNNHETANNPVEPDSNHLEITYNSDNSDLGRGGLVRRKGWLSSKTVPFTISDAAWHSVKLWIVPSETGGVLTVQANAGATIHTLVDQLTLPGFKFNIGYRVALASNYGAAISLYDIDNVFVNAIPVSDHWTTYNTKSLLGGSLLGKKNYAAAEPLLLEGYEGMNQHEADIPFNGKIRLTEAIQRLVDLYDATNQKNKATEWRAKLRKPTRGSNK